ncbi:MAG: DUF5107 domain-containing protein [Draconibacterium sp.]
MHKKIRCKREKMVLPTYGLGQPEINPMFFEKRVYQGSSGKVYPVPFIDKVFDTKADKHYDSVILENDFIRLVLLPEIGGRIFEAQDKTNNNYDFFYKQHVIKPALVGLAGPWISGGVEFNWPQHHRPGTYLPTAVHIEEEADGARTVWMSEYDPMNRLKGMHGIRVRPNSSLIELRGRLFNPTPITQTFLWWANVAVRVHDDYQSFFPPDVHYVADHAVRALSSFPLAENDYYGIPYHKRPGNNDLRRYQNIPVPTSYMVCNTKYDFFGGYDFQADGGLVHVANRHIAPGKKQWTWGNEAFGRAWDRELTDKDGPYFELMAGVYTDNQPDFTYLLPYETKTFSQFWWSYKNLGPVQNANKDLALRLVVQNDNSLDFGVAASKHFESLTLILKIGNQTKVFSGVEISPKKPWKGEPISVQPEYKNALSLLVESADGKELITYHQRETAKTKERNVAFEPKQANEIKSANELELIGEHLEQYRHPTRYPETYWKEAIKRDPDSYKSYIALGRQEYQKGNFGQAESQLKEVLKIITRYHPNPSTGEAHYYCGLACSKLEKTEEAYSLFYKASWNFEWRSAAFYQLALIDCQNRDFETALEHLEASLDTNRINNKAWVLKAVIKRKTGNSEAALKILSELAKQDALDTWANFEKALISGNFDPFIEVFGNDAQTMIDIAFEYAEAGFYGAGLKAIEFNHANETTDCAVPNPMHRSPVTSFIEAWLHAKIGEMAHSERILKSAVERPYNYFFPSRINEQIVLEWAVEATNFDPLPAYGLGNYYYNLKRHTDAISIWEKAAENCCAYATLYRNLGIAYWNTFSDGEKARKQYLKAIELAPEDMRIQFEYDQLRKKLNDDPKQRLTDLEAIKTKITQRDNFSVELAALYNFNGQFEKAFELLSSRNFHPWEGGEGQVLKQYSQACLNLGKTALQNNRAEEALEWFLKSLNTPDNLGEKYHPLQAVAHINYWLGKAHLKLGNTDEANKYFIKSANEEGDFINMAVSSFSELTYYSALSLSELNRQTEAAELLQKMKQFAEQNLDKEVKIDYFATSLPLLLVFDDDLQKRNTWENTYLLALAEKGLGNIQQGKQLATEVMKMNVMHDGARELSRL